MKSRKLSLLYVVLILATVGTFAPPLTVWLCGVFGKNVASFSILGSTEWVSMITLVVSTYFGSNVWEKHVALSNGIMPNDMNSSTMQMGSSGRFGQSKDLTGKSNQETVQQTIDENAHSDDQNGSDDKEALKDALKHGR